MAIKPAGGSGELYAPLAITRYKVRKVVRMRRMMIKESENETSLLALSSDWFWICLPLFVKLNQYIYKY